MDWIGSVVGGRWSVAKMALFSRKTVEADQEKR